MSRIKVGVRIQVTGGSGIDSHRIGTVIARNRIQVDGRGIPKIAGYYKPMSPDEVALIDDHGQMFTMFRNRLRVIA